MLPLDIKKSVPVKVANFLDYTATLGGLVEDPPGSNRGPELDAWAREFGSPLGSPWCALMVGHTRKKFGLWTPARDVGSCDEWVLQAKAAQLFSHTPSPGAAVIYTNWVRFTSGRYKGLYDANHMGTMLRAAPYPLAWEGNTAVEKHERNGEVMALKKVTASRVYGYIGTGL